jgi:hypothetical protein
MQRFNARSPFIVTVYEDVEQIATRLVLDIYSQLGYLLKTYTLEKKRFSPTQYKNYYNISPYVYDLLNTIDENAFSVVVELTAYYTTNGVDYSQTTNDIPALLVASNGYSDYNNPNYLQTANFIPLMKEVSYTLNYDRTLTYPTADFVFNFIGNSDSYYYKISNGSTFYTENIPNNGSYNFFRLPLTISGSAYSEKNVFNIFRVDQGEPVKIFQLNLVNLCESKYNPIKLDFINRLGGKQSMYFFKNSTQSIEVKSSEYNTNTFDDGYPIYNGFLGQKRIYNKNGTKTIKCNSGWINEVENENIQDIMLSENLLLTYDEEGTTLIKAVTLKSSSQLFKTHLNEKVINYELEFEVASSLINNVV